MLRESPKQHPGKGRKPKNSPKPLSPHPWLNQPEWWQTQTVAVRGRRLKRPYRVPDRPLFLIVIHANTWLAGKKEPRRKHREPCYYLESAILVDGQWVLPLLIEDLLAWLWQRWELEVTHRELKSGLVEKPCWNKQAAVRSVQWSAWVYALLVLAAFRT